MSHLLNDLSDELRARTLAAQSLVVAVGNSQGRHLAATLWHEDVVITSEQAMGHRESYSVVQNGNSTSARIVGRDSGTNVIALRTQQALTCNRPGAAEPSSGGLALAFGATATGTPTVRLGLVNAVAPEWHSREGGLIDARINLDIRLGRTEEGGPVLDAQGRLLGMSTFGVGGEVLVIPSATIERVLSELLQQGYVRRGWLGLALQPIAIPDGLRELAGNTHGMIVVTLVADGPGAKAGVIAGDILISLDGMPVHRMRQLSARLDSNSVGKEMELRVLRGGQIVTLTTEITARPPT